MWGEDYLMMGSFLFFFFFLELPNILLIGGVAVGIPPWIRSGEAASSAVCLEKKKYISLVVKII